jgi:hypothetical protein
MCGSFDGDVQTVVSSVFLFGEYAVVFLVCWRMPVTLIVPWVFCDVLTSAYWYFV